MPKNPVHKTYCHYYGPITKPGKPSIGGYEAANRKNIDSLRRQGVDVIEHPNPVKPKSIFGALVYLKLFINPLSLIKSANDKDTVVHITPLPRMLWYPSLFCAWFAKRMGLKTVIDIRAGSFIRFYENRSSIYRLAVRRMLANADAVTVEGKAYVEYIREITGGKKVPHYFPNTMKPVSVAPSAKSDRRFNIFYFGRISPTKGIDVMLDTIACLGSPFHLYLAGNIADDIDKSRIMNAENVTYLGSLTPEQLNSKKREMGFFIFPSTWSGEGQSNSLIEAMGAGLVPVASDNGFTIDVVADAGYVFPTDATGKDYADAIAKCAGQDFDTMSSKAAEHIRQCHNLDNEISKLKEIYIDILSSK